MPALGLKGRPRTVTANVRRISNGIYHNEGPMARGELGDMGPSALLDTGKVEIAVISRHVEPFDIAPFRALGIEPAKKRLRDAEEPRALARGPGPDGEGGGRMRRRGVCTRTTRS